MDQITRFRINLSAREIEFGGSEAFVKEQIENYKDFIDGYKNQQVSQTSGISLSNIPKSEQTKSQIPSDLPSSFGEYYHSFPKGLTKKEEILIAANFVQKNSPDKTFTTKTANSLLLDLGIRLSNPSHFVSDNKIAKNVFPVSKGVFRVSNDGETYIKNLLEKSE